MRSRSRITSLEALPEGCVSEILALTSPRDAGRFSVVSKTFRSSAESDSVWNTFLPPDYQSILAESVNPIPEFSSKKELYVYLCQNSTLIDGGRKLIDTFLPSDYQTILDESVNPIPEFSSKKELYVYLCQDSTLIGDGCKSFSLDKWTGKKCYCLGARDLKIVWSDTTEYWEWTSVPESRFPEVAELKLVWWLEICGTIRVGILSPRTTYAAYFVYKLKDDYGFGNNPSEVSVGISGVESQTRYVFLDQKGLLQNDDVPDDWRPWARTDDDDDDDDDDDLPPQPPQGYDSLKLSDVQHPKLRSDGWFEVELGEFVNENEDDSMEMCLKEVVSGLPKGGLFVEGIEIRPIRH